MAKIKIKIMPETSMRFKQDSVVIDGVVAGSIEIIDDKVSILFDGKETIFKGGVITFGVTNVD